MVYHTDDLIDVREAARQCDRNAETVRRWIWGGKLPAQKLGNQLFIKKKDLALFCRETATLAYKTEPGITRTTGNRTTLLKRVSELRGQIRSRTGVDFNTLKDIEEMRKEREKDIMPGDGKINRGKNKPSDGDGVFEKAVKLRNSIYARTGKMFDVEAMIRETRDERDKEIRRSLR